MTKYAKKKWDKNRGRLYNRLFSTTIERLKMIGYEDLMRAVVEDILGNEWDADSIIIVDNGDYQGTLLFLIPRNGYQPAEYDYLMTFINYGSCDVCDTLMEAQAYSESQEALIADLMHICADLVTNMIKPYNFGWREDSEFETVEETICDSITET